MLANSTLFTTAIFNYHHFRLFQHEKLRRQFLITGIVVTLGISSSLGFEYANILKTLPWGLFGATIVCSLWYRFGIDSSVESVSEVGKRLEDVVGREPKVFKAALV